MSEWWKVVTGAAITLILFVALPIGWKWSCWSAGRTFRLELDAAAKASRAGDYSEAKKHLQTARDQIGLFGVSDDFLQTIRYEEAKLAMEMGQHREAEKLAQAALAQTTSEQPRVAAECHLLLGIIYTRQERFDEARRELETAYAGMQKAAADDRTSIVAQWLSEVCLGLHEHQEAMRFANAACEYARKEANSPLGKTALGAREDQLGRVLQVMGRYAEAADRYAEALQLLDQGLPPDVATQHKVLHDYFYVLEVLERPALIAELEQRYNVKSVHKEHRPEENPTWKFDLRDRPLDPPVLLFDKRVPLTTTKQAAIEVECERGSETRLQFQVELLDRTNVGPSSPLGKVFGQATVSLLHQSGTGPIEAGTLIEEKQVTFAESFDWKVPAGRSRIRVSFGAGEVTFDMRVRLLALAP